MIRTEFVGTDVHQIIVTEYPYKDVVRSPSSTANKPNRQSDALSIVSTGRTEEALPGGSE